MPSLSRHLGALCLLLLPLSIAAPAAQAQDAGQGGTLRQRLIERWLERKAARDEAKLPPAETASGQAITTPGDHRFTLSVGGRQRSYLLHVPRTVQGGQPLPLLVALHGGGGSARIMADDGNYGLVSASEQRGFVVVFPNGISKISSGALATWNAGRCCGAARDEGVDDVGFIRTVVGQVQGMLPIDRQRIYATGMSNGGMMAQRLACEAADLFRAIASVAGTDNTTGCSPSRPIAVLHIHAKDDPHVLFNGGAGGFRDESKVTDFTSVPETIRRWVGRDRCSPTPRNVLSRPGASCERYTGCAGGAQVQLCVTDTGGHSWPGTTKSAPGKEGPSQAIRANDVIWDFFQGL